MASLLDQLNNQVATGQNKAPDNPYTTERLKALRTEATSKPGFFRGFFYGPKDGGKTTGACSIGNKRVAYFRGDSHGDAALINHPRIRERVDTYKIESLIQFGGLAKVINDPDWEEYDNIVIDGIDTAILDHMDLTINDRMVFGDHTKRLSIADWDVYNHAKAEVRRYIVPLTIHANKHLVFISHQRVSNNFTGPDLPQAVCNILTRTANVVAYVWCNIIQRQTPPGHLPEPEYIRYAQVRPTNSRFAACKIPELGVYIKEPNWHNIVEEWLAKGAPLDETTPNVLPDVIVPADPFEGFPH